MEEASKCPYVGASAGNSMKNGDWWPNALNLKVLQQNSKLADPMGDDFDYAAEFNKLDLPALKNDIDFLLTDSQDWWPADYGHYGPFFIRMAWHSAGTYRISDGRGGAGAGMQRFAPLNSWPDNVSLDKARRLLWPIKKKYGRSISWADLMILAGNCALESMGLKIFGFGGGRPDAWEPDETYWGKEVEWLADNRYSGERDLENPLAAVQMGLIYVNPEGPNGNPDPLLSAVDIRETFARMAMNDEETVALIAGGHTFGKTHGAGDPSKYVGQAPEGAPIELMGLGWKNSLGSGNGAQTISSGLEGAWNATPTSWDNMYFETLFAHDWVQTKSPAGATQWIPKNGAASQSVPDAHDPTKRHAPVMTTADLALRFDPIYEKISRNFLENPDRLADAFSRAWFKLTHRDMGPIARYLGSEVPSETLIWQDPLPRVDHKLVSAADIALLKRELVGSQFTVSQLVITAWASASTYRGTDRRGGANGARIALEPQRSWEVNTHSSIQSVLDYLGAAQRHFNSQVAQDGVQISLADLIVLAGVAAVEKAAEDAGISIEIPFKPGRADATQEQTDVDSFAVLEHADDAFRNYFRSGLHHVAEFLMVDQAALLTLTPPEMTVLLGGMRVLKANTDDSKVGVLTNRPGVLTNDFFVNITDSNITWQRQGELYEGLNRAGEVLWSASRADLIFGSNSQLRPLSEVYASDDAARKFVEDFAAVWTKVMDLDRF